MKIIKVNGTEQASITMVTPSGTQMHYLIDLHGIHWSEFENEDWSKGPIKYGYMDHEEFLLKSVQDYS